MANLTRRMKYQARQDKDRRLREEYDRLVLAVNEAQTDEEREEAENALSEYYEAREEEDKRKSGIKEARLAARQAKREAAGNFGGGRRLVWAEGGREALKDCGVKKNNSEFFAAATGNLVKSHRDIDRWSLDSPYDNVRGIRRGEIMMVISDHYDGRSGKKVVDVMVGADIIKGVPAAALRPIN